MTNNVDVLGGINDSIPWKAPCMVATTADMTSTMIGLPVLDGYQTQAYDRILVRDNTDQTTNGIYVASLSAWARAIDFSNSSGVALGTQVRVNQGTTYNGAYFVLATPGQPGQIVFGSSNIVFELVTAFGG